MAFLDDICLVSKLEEVREGYRTMERELWRHAKIRVHEGKTHIWNRVGTKPAICDELQRMAEVAQVQGCGAGLRCPLKNRASRCWEHLWATWISSEDTSRTSSTNTRCCCKAFPESLMCSQARENNHLRVMRPEVALEFAQSHDENLWRGLCAILEVPTTACTRNALDVSSLPLSLGGLGLRSAARTPSTGVLGELGRYTSNGTDQTPTNR